MADLSLTFSRDGRFLAASLTKETIGVWDLFTGKQLRTFRIPEGPAHSLTLSPKGDFLAGAVRNEIWLWALSQDAGPISPTVRNRYPVTALAFQSDGKILASGDDDGHVRFWDVTTGSQFKESLPNQPSRITRILFAPDDKTLFVAANGRPARLFDASNQELVRLPVRGPLAGATFSRDGSLLAVGTAVVTLDGVTFDSEIQVWNIGPLLWQRK